jgi:hypothetical protein
MPAFESEISEYIEGLEAESEAAEAAEAARRGVRKPSGASSFRPRPAPSTPTYVTQTQLQASLARVDGKIKTVSDGVSTINSRVTALAASFKKESEERKKALQSQNNDLNQKLQLLALLPVLVQSPTATLTTALPTQGGGSVSQISLPDTSTLDTLLPLLLVSGLGSTGGLSLGGDSSSSPGSDNSFLLMALVLAMSKQGQ